LVGAFPTHAPLRRALPVALALAALALLAPALAQAPPPPDGVVTVTVCPTRLALAPGEQANLTGDVHNEGNASVLVQMLSSLDAAAGSAVAVPAQLALAAHGYRPLDVRVTATGAARRPAASLTLAPANGELLDGWSPLVVNVTPRASPGPQPDASSCARAQFALPLPPPPRNVVAAAARAAASSPLPVSEAGLALGGGAAVGAGLVVWLARSEDRWLRLVVAPLLPLFTRLAPPRVLDHEVRERVHRRVQESPGIHFTTPRRDLGLATGVALHHLRVVERAGLVRSRREGRYRAYYPRGERLPPEPAEPLNATAEGILALARADREVVFAELPARLGVTKSTVSYNVRLLRERGLVALVEREDGRWVVRAATGPVRTGSQPP
jgi:DNA-binding transcriptional ArsR family regulator